MLTRSETSGISCEGFHRARPNSVDGSACDDRVCRIVGLQSQYEAGVTGVEGLDGACSAVTLRVARFGLAFLNMGESLQ